MIYSRRIVSEALKSAFISVGLFTLFDLFIQGYNNYHDWIISAYVLVFSIYGFIAKRSQKY